MMRAGRACCARRMGATSLALTSAWPLGHHCMQLNVMAAMRSCWQRGGAITPRWCGCWKWTAPSVNLSLVMIMHATPDPRAARVRVPSPALVMLVMLSGGLRLSHGAPRTLGDYLLWRGLRVRVGPGSAVRSAPLLIAVVSVASLAGVLPVLPVDWVTRRPLYGLPLALGLAERVSLQVVAPSA